MFLFIDWRMTINVEIDVSEVSEISEKYMKHFAVPHISATFCCVLLCSCCVFAVFYIPKSAMKDFWFLSESVSHSLTMRPKEIYLRTAKKNTKWSWSKVWESYPPLPPSIVVQTCVWPEVCFPDFVACGETVYQIEGAAEQINQFVQRRPPIHPSGAKFNKQTNWASDDVGRAQASTKTEWI